MCVCCVSVSDRRQARIHPFSLLMSLEIYKRGQGYQGKKKWEPDSSIIKAMESAFYKSFVVRLALSSAAETAANGANTPLLLSERGARGRTLHRGGGRQHLAEQRGPGNAGQHGHRCRSHRHGKTCAWMVAVAGAEDSRQLVSPAQLLLASRSQDRRDEPSSSLFLV